MKAKPVLIASTIICLFFAIGFLFMGSQIHTLLGVEVNKTVTVMDHYFGSALMALAVINWLARAYPDSKARRAIILGNLFYYILGGLTTILANFSVNPNAMNYGVIAFHVIMAILFAILFFKYRGPLED